MGNPAGLGRPRRNDPYGVGPGGPTLAPIGAAVLLVVVAVATVGLFSGRLPVTVGGGGNGGNGGPAITPAPSDVVIPDPRADVPGSIVYVKQGDIWVQSGTNVRRLTRSGSDAEPAWSPDGAWIYFVRRHEERGLYPAQGRATWYTLTVPVLMRIRPDGTGEEEVLSGRFRAGRYTWFYWIREPDPGPAGRPIALVSDGPDPSKSDVVLQFFDPTTKKLSRATGAPQTAPFGHQDPAWRPDGALVAYVRNDRQGRNGAPAIWRYDPDTKKSAAVTGPGYLAPSWSPDGRYLAATKTGPFGTDVVVLDARTGVELLRLTDDGRSWSPTWSPRGDAIAFLHLSGQIVDLRMVGLDGEAPNWRVGDVLDLTRVSGLDGASRPDWFIPADELPPSPPPSETPTIRPSDGAVGSPGPSATAP
ncbi:MAG: hypothetical protein KatS3mg065_0575 [Chloroflexota bacterium]|nr:MAG: hypothetical protein KatS3mg065_0575 [Chloroflexota bacterium]